MKWRKGATGWGFSVRRKDGLFVALLVIVFRGYTPAKLRHHLFHVAAAKQVKCQASPMYIREQIIAAEAAATAVLEGGVPLCNHREGRLRRAGGSGQETLIT
jgi:hypothetical protein